MPKIIITGKTGSGKSSLKNRLIRKGFRPIVQFTTREKRKGEKDGFDYDFLTEKEYTNMRNIGIDLVANHQYGNGTRYGITQQRWESGSVLAVGMKELEQMDSHLLGMCIIIYIDPPEDVLIQRLKSRADFDTEVHRRLQTDAEDFANFDWWDIRLENPNDFKI